MSFRLSFPLVVLIWLNTFNVIGQSITLDDCQEKAAANYPAIARYDIIEKTKNFDIANANKLYLPQGTLSAQASWQSEVTSINLDLPQGFPPIDIPEPSQDQYKVAAELNQLIWDGGKISAQKKSIDANAELEKKQLDSEIYKLKERVNNLYFGILLIREQINQQEILEKELQRNYNNVQSYVQNGVANEADLSVVKVELLKVGQQRIQLESSLQAFIQMLSVFIGDQLDTSTIFIKPSPVIALPSTVVNRPELQAFIAQENVLESQRSLLNSKNSPIVGAFAQGGYGKPGLNMFKNEFSPYFLGGVRITWNFGNLYTLKNDKKKIDLQKLSVDTQRDTFLHNLNMQIPQQQIEIEKFRKIMKDDNEIIRLRTLIRESAETKVENGTMTVSDLMKEINAEESAKQSKNLHEIQYLMSIYSLEYTTNSKK
ncbi:MAG: TolC family protein [Dysgonamonadaceae bacterium]|jgi:outer membrane protein TolC|nr:TolC family protein [Dysgonamonadaceae bacterium]